jgi:hypothetical protein
MIPGGKALGLAPLLWSPIFLPFIHNVLLAPVCIALPPPLAYPPPYGNVGMPPAPGPGTPAYTTPGAPMGYLPQTTAGYAPPVGYPAPYPARPADPVPPPAPAASTTPTALESTSAKIEALRKKIEEHKKKEADIIRVCLRPYEGTSWCQSAISMHNFFQARQEHEEEVTSRKFRTHVG